MLHGELSGDGQPHAFFCAYYVELLICYRVDLRINTYLPAKQGELIHGFPAENLLRYQIFNMVRKNRNGYSFDPY